MAASALVNTENVKFTEGEAGFDLEWFKAVVGAPAAEVAEVTFEDMSAAGGLSGRMRRVVGTDSKGNRVLTLVLKETFPSRVSVSKALGLNREALFFHEFSPILGKHANLPTVYVAHADTETGYKAILMEDLADYVQAGYMFGPYTPLNAGQDLEAAVAATGGITARRVAAATFLCGARLHAPFWNKVSELQKHSWLRGAAWSEGKGEEGWMQSQKSAKDLWEVGKKAIEEGKQAFWSPEMIALLDASFEKISWEEHMERLSRGPLTLVHGDFHPANMMWKRSATPVTSTGSVREDAESDCGSLALLDFEVVGIGSGPQDLAQFLISHMHPDERRACESELLELYHEELGRQGVDLSTFTMEQLRSEYARGCVERWMWLMGYIAGACPEPITKFLHGQVWEFAKDHGIDASNVGQPRS
jgi:hypothetical protein